MLIMVDEGTPTPPGDPMELVMRAFLAQNRALFAALYERDLWPGVQLGFGAFPRGERTDPRRLAALVRRSHGDRVTASVQFAERALEKDRAPVDLTILTVHGLTDGASAPLELRPIECELLPLLDLTTPLQERAR